MACSTWYNNNNKVKKKRSDENSSRALFISINIASWLATKHLIIGRIPGIHIQNNNITVTTIAKKGETVIIILLQQTITFNQHNFNI